MTKKQRARVEVLKRLRAKLTSPFDRIAFDNAASTKAGDEALLRLVASLESEITS